MRASSKITDIGVLFPWWAEHECIRISIEEMSLCIDVEVMTNSVEKWTSGPVDP